MITALRLQNKNPLLRTTLLSALLSLMLAPVAYAAASKCPSSVTYSNSAVTECPGYDPTKPTTACAAGTAGPLTQAVLQGCDPPTGLRPDQGAGKTSSNIGSITQGGKCPPPINGGAPFCTTTPNSNTSSVPPATPLSNPYMNNPASNNLPSVPLSGLSSLPSLPCGGGVPLLNQISSFGNNLNLGSILSVGNINIGIPPVNLNPPANLNLPSFNISVPSLSLPTLSIPDDLPNINIPVPSVSTTNIPSVSLPNIGSLASCPNLNLQVPPNISLPNINLPSVDINIPSASMPSLNASIPNAPSLSINPSIAANFPSLNLSSMNISMPSIPNFNLGTLPLNTPMPDLTLPTLSVPSLSIPSLSLPTTCSVTPTFGSVMGNLDNLLSANLLNTGQSVNGVVNSGINTISNALSSLCQGSSLQLSQTNVSLVLPSITTPLDLSASNLSSTVASLSPPTPLTTQTISYPPAGQVYNIPVNSPLAFNVYEINDVILPNGGTTIAPNGTMETLAGNSMFIVITPGPWDGKNAQVVVGTDIANPITPSNRADVKVQFPNTTINGCTYTNIGDVENGVLQMNPFWRCPCDHTHEHDSKCYRDDDDWSDGVSKVFTLAPLVQDYSGIPTSKPNIDITTSAIVMNEDQPSSTVPAVVPPSGSFLSIPDNTPITFNVSTSGTMVMPAGGSFIDPSGNTVDIGQNGVLQSSGNGQVTLGYALQNVDGTYKTNADGSIQYTSTGTVITYPATQTYVSVTTSEIEVPPGASLPISATGSIAMPQAPD